MIIRWIKMALDVLITAFALAKAVMNLRVP